MCANPRRAHGLTLAVAITLSVAGLACDLGPTEPVSPLESAWTDFREGRIDAASSAFEAKLSSADLAAEAHLGVGWCRLVRAQLPDAITHLRSALAFEDGTDARVALALADAATSEWSTADSFAALALDAQPSYIFRHRADINFADVHLVRSQAAYARGDFASSERELRMAYASVQLPPSSDADYVARLAQQIEVAATALRGVWG